MIWERTEEGQKSRLLQNVHLTCQKHLVIKIIRLWQLEKVIGNGSYFEPTHKKETGDYIYFRWDKQIVIQSEKEKINGVYNVYGHKPELELIPYGNLVKRDFLEIQFEENIITIKFLNTDKTVTRQFRRIPVS